MAISFANIPGNIRVPLAYFEFSPELAGSFVNIQNTLLLGTVAAGSGLAINSPTPVFSPDEVRMLAGPGSAFARQADAYFRNNAQNPLYLLAAAETGFTFSWGAIEWDGPATASGTVSLYIAGRLVRFTIGTGDTPQDMALACMDAINTNPQLGVTAYIDAAAPDPVPPVTLPKGDDVVQIRAMQGGILGGVDIGFSLAGAAGGEMLPAGVTATITPMLGGAGRPDIAALLSAAGDAPFDFVISPFPLQHLPPPAVDNDLNALDEFFNDTTGRWSWQSMLYGHGFTCTEQRIGGLINLGRQRNGQHVTIMGFFGSATPHDEWLAAYAGQAAGSLSIDPARPCQALPLIGVRAPSRDNRFTRLERQTLYFSGVSATYTDDANTVYIDRLITTYQRNRWGAPDNSYLDIETMYSAAYYSRSCYARITTKFPRHKLASDGQRFGAGQAIVTPRIMRAELIAHYGELIETGIVEDLEGFEQALIVERDSTDPNRLNAFLSPSFVNQLRIFAALVAFRLHGAEARLAA
jgi:phage tail sheath gpL-like